MQKLVIYNTLRRKKEEFAPINPPHVGMYVCGPTVYGEAHLGHARPSVTFDVLFRYLQHIGYKVRYVRNITDVGHLENDADTGEDKIAKKARLEQLEPMEIVQLYTLNYHDCMKALNVLPPSIEPRASGHIIEQQEYVQRILDSGFAYESQGSVYFDVEKYNKQHNYGILSGRNIDDMLSNTRSLDGQDEKRAPLDFALWKKAKPEHIMQWNSVWSKGFPGWHLECSAMGEKYLGKEFDIHGGGMDLMFPHHECEIAQSTAANGKSAVRYWIHNNMITINGQKMGKSLGNFITLQELFSGSHKILEQAYTPMTIRFFILQAHYRSTLDFSNEALQAAQKGMERLLQGYQTIQKLPVSVQSTVQVNELSTKCYDAISDDLNTPILISHLFVALKDIQAIAAGAATITQADKDVLEKLYRVFLFDILGLQSQADQQSNNSELLHTAIEMLLQARLDAKKNKDFAKSDEIRNTLTNLGVVIKDTKDGYEWSLA
ncbi:MAG: Cysteine--tRNA ligase [Bacteroidetes bacterium ADurb.Bin217]|nr:MAG: Cysteine--tRNA ligase [Bacteroidetes bacterium ADurb.Bin217]